MIKNDRVYGMPLEQYKDTKANIEALSGVGEGAIAYATDSNELGSYDGATWTWGQGGSTAPATTAANDFQVGSDSGTWIKKTLAEVVAILRTALDSVYAATSHTHAGYIPENGWVAKSETWTRTGNFTFTISGDVTSTYRKKMRVRYKDGGAYEYGIILSTAYSAPNTTVTLITNDDYTMAATTITDKYLSVIDNPDGWPVYFDYTPSASASGSMSVSSLVVGHAKYADVGGIMHNWISAEFTLGGTPSTDVNISLVVTNSSAPTPRLPAVAQIRNAGSGNTIVGGAAIGSGVLAFRNYDVSNWTTGTGRRATGYAAYDW